MDVTSYLLGKQAGGGGGSTGMDWTALGYNGVPNYIQKGYDYALQIKKLYTPRSDMSYAYESVSNDFVFMPLIDTSMVTNMEGMLGDNAYLEYVPILNTSNVYTMRDMFNGSIMLTNESLNNILKMCINATSYTDEKILSTLGLSGYYYSRNRFIHLPNYQDFINAGWTLGN